MLHGFETHSSYLISVLKYSRILDDAVSFAFVSFRKFAALCPGFFKSDDTETGVRGQCMAVCGRHLER